jgi:hypothetical protein
MIATLDSFFTDVTVHVQSLEEKIKQRRTQMLVHSYLYYVMDDSVVTDGKWQDWANELVALQKQKTDIGFYDEEFSNWDGSTGMDLPHDDWIVQRAKWLLSHRS